MRLVHIVAGVPPGSGIAEAALSLCRHLRLLGHEVTLATLDGPLSEAAQAAEAAGVRLLRFLPCRPRALYFSWQMLRQLRAVCADADVVQVHSHWTFPVWWGCRCALQAGKPLVMTPHGCLDPVRLRHSAWKKRLVGWIDRYFLRRASVIQATSEAERLAVARFLRPRRGRKGEGEREKNDAGNVLTQRRRDAEVGDAARLVVVPNGVELGPSDEALLNRTTQDKREICKYAQLPTLNAQRASFSHPHTHTLAHAHTGASRERVALYLGRLHPLKGLELLLEAWGLLRPRSGCPSSPTGADGWRLVIVGADEQGTLDGLVQQAERLGLRVSGPSPAPDEPASVDADVVFCEPVYGAAKAWLLAQTDLFVLPSRSENFGIVVAEALAAGVPVITTRATPWSELLRPLRGRNGECKKGERLSGCDGEGEEEVVPPVDRCGWWVDVGVEPLAEALREAMALGDDERRQMGQNGRQLMMAKYRWQAVAERMVEVYESVGVRG